MLLTIALVAITFSVLVIAHEWGHFTAARRAGVKVKEFGIGFPPRLLKKTRGGTIFSINAIPIGGFVRLKGEDGQEEGPDSFASKTAWAKTKIVMAGVIMNFLIAYLLVTFLLAVGIPPIIVQKLPEFGFVRPQPVGSAELTVLQVGPDSVASSSGVRVGDKLIGVGGQQFENSDGLKSFTASHAGQTVELVYSHDGNEQTKTITLGQDAQKGILGVVAEPVQLQRYSLPAAPIAAAVLMVQMIWLTIAGFGAFLAGLLTQAKVGDGVAGPVGIVGLFSQVTQFGWRYVLAFVAVISLSLGVINALPLPALDGGRELIILLRRIGLKITPSRENLIHLLGFVALIALLVIVTASDIARMR